MLKTTILKKWWTTEPFAALVQNCKNLFGIYRWSKGGNKAPKSTFLAGKSILRPIWRMVRRKIVLLYGRAPVIDLKIPPRPPKIKTPEPHIACGSWNFRGARGNYFGVKNGVRLPTHGRIKVRFSVGPFCISVIWIARVLPWLKSWFFGSRFRNDFWGVGKNHGFPCGISEVGVANLRDSESRKRVSGAVAENRLDNHVSFRYCKLT